MPLERLQKILARAGVASRRHAEQLIVDGRVRVNGRVVTELGTRADPELDRVEVDGKRLVAERYVYLLLHKPRGVVSTLSDPEGRPTVKDLVGSVEARVFPVGRLDFHTSGALLLTNDGAFSDGLLHPRRDVPKTYVAKVAGVMADADVRTWANGVELEDGKTRPADVKLLRHEGDKTWLEVTLYEGRNQQIRRMGEVTGFRVMRLARVSFAGVTTERLRPGRWRELSLDELSTLRDEYGVPKKLPRSLAGVSGPSAAAGRATSARGARRLTHGAPGRTRKPGGRSSHGGRSESRDAAGEPRRRS